MKDGSRRGHERQRRAETLEGILAKAEKEHLVKLHRDAQRMLRPLLIVNPFAHELTFLDHATRTRRDHTKYLTLIRTIALLHQHQRPVKTAEHRGRKLRYIEVAREDIAVANRLCHEVLGRSLDELPPQTRRLLGLIAEMVKAGCTKSGIDRTGYRFSRRHVRDYARWGNTQIKIHLGRLVEMEYVLVHRGKQGQGYVYELAFDGDAGGGSPVLSGLVNIEALGASKPLSFSSQVARLVPVRGFFKWMTRQNVLLWNPASEIELPRQEKRLPKHVLTADEAERVMQEPDVSDPIGLRDRAILETLYSTGIRRMEVMHLTVFDLDAERGTVMVRQGKGKKDRMVPIGERAVMWIEKYLDEGRPKLVMPPDAGVLFLTQEGEEISSHRLTQLVREYVNGAEIGKTGACHLFRHTCATLMLEGGADIRYIQEMLGHVELSTTQIYTQVSIRRLKAVHALTHPTAKLDRTMMSTTTPEEKVETEVEGFLPLVASAAAAPAGAEHVDATEELMTALAAEAEEEDGGAGFDPARNTE